MQTNKLHLKKLQEIQQKLLEVRFKDSKDNLIKTIKDKEIVDEILETIEKFPKSKQGTYLQWLVNLYKSNPKEFIINNKNILKNLVNYNDAIDKNIPNVEKNFLAKIKTLDDFLSFIPQVNETIDKHKKFKTKEKDTTILFKNEEWFVVIPQSTEAAIKYGKGTKWCTAALNDNEFQTYDETGVIIYFINKKTTKKNLAMYYSKGEMELQEFWNSKDEMISEHTIETKVGKSIYNKVIENFEKVQSKLEEANDAFILKLQEVNDLVNQNKEISKETLEMKDKYGDTIAHHLAQFNPTWITNDKEILKISNIKNTTVAHYLAQFNPTWITNDKEILMLKNNFNRSVAHFIAFTTKNWITKDKEIWESEDNNGETVGDWYAMNQPEFYDKSHEEILKQLENKKV